MTFSFIVPVYNRPDEVRELLDSIVLTTVLAARANSNMVTESSTTFDFEVIIVEDGSSVPCKSVVEGYRDKCSILYLEKENAGPSAARNYGAQHSKGEYLVFLDSDVILPAGYFAALYKSVLDAPNVVAFGAADAAADSFTPLQKAITYSMTSFFTTGGIRSSSALDKFYPRSYNMGVRRDVFSALGGFAADMRFGEDIDLSLRIFEAGYSCVLFPEAWVYHKRRTDFRKFFRQVYNSGIARINLYKRHPQSLKIVHSLPAVFTVGVALLILSSLGFATLAPTSLIALYAIIVGIDATRQYHSLNIGLLSIAAAFIQLTGYGTGFLVAYWQRCILNKPEFTAFPTTFYK